MKGIKFNTLNLKKILIFSYLLFVFPISLKIQYAFLGLAFILVYLFVVSNIIKSKLRTNKIALSALPFIIWVFLSISQKQLKYEIRISDYRLLATYIVYFIFLLNSYELKTKDDKKRELIGLIKFFVMILTVPIIAGALIWIFKPDIYIPFLNTFEYQKNGMVYNTFWNGRYLSYFINPNDFSYILITVMWCILLIFTICKGLSFVKKLGYGTIFIFSYICFINSASRGGWIAASLGIGLYLWLMKDKIFKRIKICRGKSILTFFLSVSLAGLSLVFFYSSYVALSYYDTYVSEHFNADKKDEVPQTLSQNVTKDIKQVQFSRNLVSQAKTNISNGRFDIWKIYFKGLWVEPLLGVTHNNKEAIYKYFQENYPNDPLSSKGNLVTEVSTPHNIVFMLAGYYGLGGLALFLIFISLAAVTALKSCKKAVSSKAISENAYIYTMLVCYWGIIVFNAMVGNILIEYFTCINIMAWDYLGYLLSTRNDF